MVTAVRLADPKYQFFDNNGLPLALGFVYTYAAGTSVPLATYTDSTGTSSNTNPIQLDSSGRAEIWFDGSVLYKIVVTDSLGSQLYSEDNFPGYTTSGSGSSQTFPGTQASVPSGSLVDLGSAGSNNVLITGTVGITDFGSTATLTNPLYLIAFNGILTVTASANVIIRSGITVAGNNLTTAGGDKAYIYYNGSGSWTIFAYYRADGSFDCTTIRFHDQIDLGS